jgi:phosphoribosylformylglycinamidine synthase
MDFRLYWDLIQAGLIESAHDCADGGLAVALVECALPAGIGLTVNLPSHDLPPEFRLFGEDASRVVVSCDPAQLPRIKQVAEEYDISADVLGETTASNRVEIAIDRRAAISANVEELGNSYEGALEKALRTEPSDQRPTTND